MRRRKQTNPFSLFSFQDIITGLCGIMIFMVLVQVVGIVLERGNEDRPLTDSAQIVDTRDALQAEIAQLEKKLAALKKKSAHAIVSVQDKAKPGEAEKLTKDLTEKELVVAALVSQVHDLETQVEKARNADAEDRAKIREMERTRRLLEQQIAGMKNRRGITLIPERGEFKVPIYMICSWAGLEIHHPFENRPSVQIPLREVESRLEDYLTKIDHTTHAVVLLVRPSGVNVMYQAMRILKNQSFSFGRDPLEETLEITFSPKEGK